MFKIKYGLQIHICIHFSSEPVSSFRMHNLCPDATVKREGARKRESELREREEEKRSRRNGGRGRIKRKTKKGEGRKD